VSLAGCSFTSGIHGKPRVVALSLISLFLSSMRKPKVVTPSFRVGNSGVLLMARVVYCI
jgi:hypothetical protein